jgi:hypothetical protein
MLAESLTQPGGGTAMNRLTLPTAVLSAIILGAGLLPGCGQEAASSSHAGVWELDIQVVKDAMMAEIEAMEDSAEREAMELGMAMIGSGMLDTMSMVLVLNPDGTASSTSTMMGESDTVHGTWSAKGDLLTIEMTEGGESDSVSALVDDDTLELLPPEGEEMPFRMIMRKRAE